MAPKKMSLGEFLTDQEFGDWADDDIDINSISVPIGKPVTHHDAYRGYGGNHYRSNQRDFPVLQGPPFIAKFSNIPETATRVLIKDLFESRFCNYDRIKLLIDPHPPTISRLGTDSHQRRKCAFVQVASAAILQKVLKWQDLNLGRIRISVACADRDDFQSILDYNKTIGYDDEAEEIQFKLGKQPRRASVAETSAGVKPEVQSLKAAKTTEKVAEPQLEGSATTKKPVTILKREEPPTEDVKPAHVEKVNPFGAAKPVKTVPEDVLKTKKINPEPVPTPKINPFGAAKPVNILAKEKEIEERLKELERERERAREEAKREKERKEHERKEKERERKEKLKEKQREKLKERQKEKALELERKKEKEAEKEKEKEKEKEAEKEKEKENEDQSPKTETGREQLEEGDSEKKTELRKEAEKKQPFKFKKKERPDRQARSGKDLETQRFENKSSEKTRKSFSQRESKKDTSIHDQKDKNLVSSPPNTDDRVQHRTVKQFHNKTYRRPDLVESPSNLNASAVTTVTNDKESALPKDKNGNDLQYLPGHKTNGHSGQLNHLERKERDSLKDQDRAPRSRPRSRDNAKVERSRSTSFRTTQPAQPKDTENVESEASKLSPASTGKTHRNGTREYKPKRKSQVFHNKRYVRKEGTPSTSIEETKKDSSSQSTNADPGN
ncbi:hypothetical protein KP2612_002322 [Komagataella phaffii]